MIPLSGCTSQTVGTSWSLKWQLDSNSSSSDEDEDDDDDEGEEEDEDDEEEEEEEESRVSVRSTDDLLSFRKEDGVESLRRTGDSSSSSSTISSVVEW